MNTVFTSILNVLAIIALVAVGVFLIVLLTDLLLSVIDGKNGIFFKRNKKEEVKTLELENDLEEQPKQIEQKAEEKSEIEQNSNVNLELAESERLALLGERDALASQNEDLKQRIEALEAKNEQPKEEEQEPVSELSDEELDKMYAELIAELNKDDEQEDAEDEEDDEFGFDEEDVIEEQEQVAEVEQPEEIEEEQPVVEEPVEEPANEEQPEEDNRQSELEDEIAKLKELLEKTNQEKSELEKQLEERPMVQTVEADSYTLEDLLAQKEQLEERLKSVNKELKANKKEYIPLARIKKTLENDEAKLRRREAIVAKKKIMLFGVTNYVVDPEKEKELSEDLDQLEALRLSVQHCEEVMTENKDRYPLLERSNKILVETVDHIKSDIEAVNQKIDALQSKGSDDTTSDGANE